MLTKYFNLMLFYIFTTSCIIIVCGLNFEGVGSDGNPSKSKSLHDKGKKPSADSQNPTDSLKTFAKVDVKKGQNSSSSSFVGVKTMEEPLETTAETSLRDTLDIVCKNLKIVDLMNVALVCKSWNKIATREISNKGLQRALLPHIYSRDILNANANFHVKNILNTKPYVALLFFTPCPREINIEDEENRILASYRRFFPQHLVTIGVDVSMMDENVITYYPMDLDSSNGILGLFIPQYKDLQIKVSSCSILAPYDISHCATQIINDLMVDANKKSTIIIFGSFLLGIHAANNILDLIKSRFAQRSYSLWGGVFNERLIHSKSTEDISRQATTLFALNLSGTNLKSWSIVVDCRMKKHEFDKKLLKFKNSLKVERNAIGLVYGPRYVEDTRQKSSQNMYLNHNELMDAVKKIFPNISFTGVFNSGYFSQIGIDSMIEDNNQPLAHIMSLSLMIITHH